MRLDVLKSNYGIKRGFSVARSRSLALSVRRFKFEKLQLGFLLIELMMAIFIGLVLISLLMRMQSLLIELEDSFYMREKALGLVVERLECDAFVKNGVDKNDNISSVIASYGRNFSLNLERNYSENNLFIKVKAEWKTLVGKKCCLEI